MPMPTITIIVDPEAAKAYAGATTEEQKKIQMILGLHFRELATSKIPSLKTLMDELSAKAKDRGLTPEILENLLNE